MSEQTAAKVTGAHLARTAYLYVRQSTLRQVLTNTESTARQYALRQRAVASIFVQRIFQGASYEKRIERRTVQKAKA